LNKLEKNKSGEAASESENENEGEKENKAEGDPEKENNKITRKKKKVKKDELNYETETLHNKYKSAKIEEDDFFIVDE
jgi:hypothetical protein